MQLSLIPATARRGFYTARAKPTAPRPLLPLPQVKALLEGFLRDIAAQSEEFARLQPLAPEGLQAAGGTGYSTKQALAFLARWRGNLSAGRARVSEAPAASAWQPPRVCTCGLHATATTAVAAASTTPPLPQPNKPHLCPITTHPPTHPILPHPTRIIPPRPPRSSLASTSSACPRRRTRSWPPWTRRSTRWDACGARWRSGRGPTPAGRAPSSGTSRWAGPRDRWANARHAGWGVRLWLD